jgi:tetratricopeptide (TPR) repeat protein
MNSRQRRSQAKASGRRLHVVQQALSDVDANALVAAALDAHRSGRIDEAEALYADALAANPDHVDALNLSGVLAFAGGRTEEAIRNIARAVKLRPDHNDARLNLAEALETAGRVPEALDCCRQAIAIAPDFVDAHARLSRLLALRNETTLALAHGRIALALQPGCVEALIGRGVALRVMRRSAEAEACFRAALEAAPDEMGAITGLASVLHEVGRLEEAEQLYRRAATFKPDEAALLATIADVVGRLGDTPGAMALFRRVLELDPRSPEFRFQYGYCLRDAGRFDLAEVEFRVALALQPDFSPAHLALVRLGRLEDSADLRKRLSRLLSDGSRPILMRVQAGFASGELLERAGEYDSAFGKYAEANAVHARARAAKGERFNRQELDVSLERFEGGLAAEFAHDTKDWGVDSELPVFVVGPLRSGTTLVEQICAAHSKVVGAGELRSIQIAAEVISGHNQRQDRIVDWDADFARAEAQKHAAWLKKMAAGAARVVDKSPFNLTRLGFVAAMFPRAKIIRCRRDPRDVAVSNHAMYFKEGNLWSTDLRDCGHLIRQLERLGDIWARTLDVPILEIVYEDLVADLDVQARRIIDFLGLEWEPACLKFYEAARHVATPSSWQVRQPIYSSSVGRWKRFEGHLGPLFEALAGQD